ncbi:MAG: transporter permease [Acidimicrobiaceae bacterium]|nr:transporter permease [Acidimicrobiaceae bacterium]
MLLGIVRRIVSMAVTLFGVAVVIFVVLRLLPGNAVTASLGVSSGLLTHAQLAALNHFYGVGEPAVQQFFSWLGSTLTGNLGISLASREPVSTLVGAALPITLELALASMVLGILIGVGFGMIGALHPGRWQDDVGQGVSVVGLAIPSFVIGTGLVTFLSSVFHYFPASQGYVSLLQNPWLNIQQIFFPALTLSLGIGAAIMNTTRAAMLEVSGLNFARTARGKGVSTRVLVWRHLFLNALVPVVTMSGIQLGYLLGGTVIVEQIFVLPGLGRLLVTSINNRDFPVVQTITLIFATGFVVVNMLVDVLYTIIDPRTRR